MINAKVTISFVDIKHKGNLFEYLIDNKFTIKLISEVENNIIINILDIDLDSDDEANIKLFAKKFAEIIWDANVLCHMFSILVEKENKVLKSILLPGTYNTFLEYNKKQNEKKDNKEIKQKDTGFGKLLPFKKQEELEKKEE